MPDQVQWHQLTIERRRELTAKCARAIERAILTLEALPDPDLRYLRRRLKSSMPTPVHDLAAYKLDEFETPTRPPRLRPTPADVSNALVAMAWLTWLEQNAHDGRRDVRLLIARAHGLSWQILTPWFRRSSDTLRRWQNGAVALIAARFWREVDTLK